MADELEKMPEMDFGIEVPVTHKAASSTLESLVQLKVEFDKKLAESEAKGDRSKTGRYKRTVKSFEDAIKATKDGKSFDYKSLTVPPGFAQIPLTSAGGAILQSAGAKSSPSGGGMKPSVSSSSIPRRAPAPPPQPKPESEMSEEELERMLMRGGGDEDDLDLGGGDDDDDDILRQLEREADNDGEPVEMDEEETHFARQLKAAQAGLGVNLPHIGQKKGGKLQPPPSHEDIMNEMEGQMLNLPQIPKQQQPRQPPKQPGAAAAASTSLSKKPLPQNRLADMANIRERQALFKEAALKAKQEGNVDVALIYLKHAKGFDQMIHAIEHGLPVNMANLPTPPQMSHLHQQQQQQQGQQSKTSPMKTSPSSHGVAAASAASSIDVSSLQISGDRKDVFKRLETDLIEQINLATKNFQSFKGLGNVTQADKFNQMARDSIKDLDGLRNSYRHGEPVPKYHFEKRAFPVIDCNSDLNDNELELEVVRGISLPLIKDFKPDDMTTYVKFEFPFPAEEPQSQKTDKQSGTLNPEYNQKFKLNIDRKQTKFLRIMNRKELKCEIYYKAGFLKSDKVLGTCNIKLQELEYGSTIHNAFELFDGRKPVGGKLEIKMRLRQPLLNKDVQVMESKWLVIDKFYTGDSSQQVSF